MMENKLNKMIYSSFIGDALSMAVHWNYSSENLVSKFGQIDAYYDPAENKYHCNRKRGEQTHYGDQMLVLLESISISGGFYSLDFMKRWHNLFTGYNGYIDGATKATITNLENGVMYLNAGSHSDDLAGAARIAPLVYFYHDNLKLLIQYAREQTMVTHNNPATVDAAEFFARVVYLILHGTTPAEAVEKIASDHFKNTIIGEWVAQGTEASDRESINVLNEFGLNCHSSQAFPGVIQLITRHKSLKDGLSECITAGGDNAARAIVTGMLLGAWDESGDLPDRWIKELASFEKISGLIKTEKG